LLLLLALADDHLSLLGQSIACLLPSSGLASVRLFSVSYILHTGNNHSIGLKEYANTQNKQVHTHHSLKPERGKRPTFGNNDVPLLDVKTYKVEHFQGSHYERQNWLS